VKKKTLRYQFAIPTGGSEGWGIKVVGKELFISVNGLHQIFIYTLNGLLIKKYGTESSGTGPLQFNNPLGLAVDGKSLYVCDSYNHRIQVLKLSGAYSHQWGSQGTLDGQFQFPCSITYSEVEGGESFLYIGDEVSVQIFTKDGNFIQRIGETTIQSREGGFNWVYGICVVNNLMYISDNCNHRIQVWRCCMGMSA